MIDTIKEILRQNNYSIIIERPIPYGCRLELNNGTIILIYPHKNKYCFQGINIVEVSRLLRDKLNKDNFDIVGKTTMVNLLNRETDNLLTHHDKEVRKQVCDEIRKEIEFEFADDLEYIKENGYQVTDFFIDNLLKKNRERRGKWHKILDVKYLLKKYNTIQKWCRKTQLICTLQL